MCVRIGEEEGWVCGQHKRSKSRSSEEGKKVTVEAMVTAYVGKRRTEES